MGIIVRMLKTKDKGGKKKHGIPQNKNEGEQKNLLRKVKKESEKAGLKLSIQKTKIMLRW